MPNPRRTGKQVALVDDAGALAVWLRRHTIVTHASPTPDEKENDANASRRGERWPFSRPLAVAEVPPEGLETSIRADAKECAALARNNLVAVARLEANFRIGREGAEGLKVSGELRAACAKPAS